MAQSKRMLTVGEVEQIQTERTRWGSALAAVLKNWCDDNGYHPRKNLGKELAIPNQAWDDLFDPRGGVCGDISVYARVHVRTGLQEADPRTIPSRVRAAPKIPGRYYEIVRAWTEQEYKSWRENYQSPPSSTQSPKRTLGSVEVPPQEAVIPQTQGWGANLERAVQMLPTISSLLETLVPAVQNLTEKLDEQGKETDEIRTVKAAVDFLHDILYKAAEGTPADREMFYRKHGERLLQILPLISALTKDRDKREVEIEMMKEMEGIAR